MSTTEIIPVTLDARFHQILGEKKADMSDDLRRQRWEEWKRLATEAGGDAAVEYWSTPEGSCCTCRFREGDWCRHSQLPCLVNPILTFSQGIQGMACMGIGYEGIPQELFNQTGPEGQ